MSGIQIFIFKSFSIFSSDAAVLNPIKAEASIENEPEEERNIRLGNLTAFGSILKSELKKENFQTYLEELQREQQEDLQEPKR